MNRLIIKLASPGQCVTCGGKQRIWVEVNDYEIVGMYPCPSCCTDQPSRDLLAPLLDYLGRPETIPDVIA